MTTGKKILFGVLPILPLIMVMVIFMLLSSKSGHSEHIRLNNLGKDPFGLGLSNTFILLCFPLAFVWIGLGMYAANVYKNPLIPVQKRRDWLLILFFTGILGQMVYFFRFILHAESTGGSRGERVGPVKDFRDLS